MFETQSSLETLRKSLEDVSSPSPWARLQDATAKMSQEQISWTLAQPEVEKAKWLLFEAFQGWLFERWKEDFSKVETYRPLVESYISTVISSAEGFGQKALGLEAENAELRRRIAELEAKDAK